MTKEKRNREQKYCRNIVKYIVKVLREPLYSALYELYCSPALWDFILLYKSFNSAESLSTTVQITSSHLVNISPPSPALALRFLIQYLERLYSGLLGSVVNPSGSPLKYSFNLFHFAVTLQIPSFHTIPSL